MQGLDGAVMGRRLDGVVMGKYLQPEERRRDTAPITICARLLQQYAEVPTFLWALHTFQEKRGVEIFIVFE